MSAKHSATTVYLDAALDLQLEQMRTELSKNYIKYSKTKIIELAVRQFVNKYYNNVAQIQLDLGLERR